MYISPILSVLMSASGKAVGGFPFHLHHTAEQIPNPPVELAAVLDRPVISPGDMQQIVSNLSRVAAVYPVSIR